MRRLSGTRKTARLSDSIHQRLNMFAVAAGAVVVSLLALAQASESKIVYTPANVVIGTNQHYNLDLNHDGVTDFTIQNYWKSSNRCQEFTYVYESPAAGNGVVPYYDINGAFAAALTQGAAIGSGQKFVGGQETMAEFGLKAPCSPFSEGPWLNVVDHYLGLSFQVNGQTHYGWARLTVLLHQGRGGGSFTATLTGYAYETIARKSINAGQTRGADNDRAEHPNASLTAPIPEPATLGRLTLWAPTITLRRSFPRARKRYPSLQRQYV
jgi:hypothetical protein